MIINTGILKGHETLKEMFNFLSQWGNPDHNDAAIPSYTCKNE